MGTELALKLVDEHELTVWNRTAAKCEPLVSAGATAASSPAEAVEDAELVVTSLFGPDDVRSVVVEPGLIQPGVVWADATTIAPADATELANAVPEFVHTPVVGSLPPAREGKLGVYVGSSSASARSLVASVVAPWAAANPDRLVEVDTAADAAVGKLLANLALAVSLEGFREALDLAGAQGVSEEQVVRMLRGTGLEFIVNMKAPFLLGDRSTDPGDFSVDAIAKDARLMLSSADTDLPAVSAALSSLEAQQEAGRGDQDLSSVVVYRG